MLPKGNHVVTIIQADDGTAVSSGNPQIVLKFENPNGAIRAWETYHPEFLRKVVALFDAAGLARPETGEFDPNDRCRLSQVYLSKLLNKQIGIIVREEADNRVDHVGEMRLRVQGYVQPRKILEDVPIDDRGLANVGASATEDDDLPF
jgi:hypothetical protein